MGMSSDSPISDMAEGAIKGALDWTVENVKSYVKKLKERKLAFIQEKKTIDIVKEQYTSGESKFYQIYIEDKELLFLVRMGLTLRKLENDPDRLRNLRDKIYKKYKVIGLHIAELVQIGVLNRYVGILIDELISIENLKEDIEEILRNIEKHVIFIQADSNISEIVKKATIIVNSHSPPIFILSGIKNASKILKNNLEKFKIILKDYNLERVSSENEEILFFKRKLK